jgi:2-oxoglutarate ferredoxin oxidoreductase subunit gamma
LLLAVMRHQIKFSGRGGEGVVLAAEILAAAAIREGKFASSIPSYGAYVKGGEVSSLVCIAEEEIVSPFFTRLDYLIAFSLASYEANRDFIGKETVVLLNAEGRERKENHFLIPAKRIAEELGSPQVLNMVLLGGFAGLTKIVSLESLASAVSERIRGNILEKELLGLKRGYEWRIYWEE